MRRLPRQLGIALLLSCATAAGAFDVPDLISVTMDNAEKLGFSASILPDSNEGERDVVLTFPRTMGENKTAVRVQLVLIDKEQREILGSSADYPVGPNPNGRPPSVLASYRPSEFDVCFTVQYLCSVPPAEERICEAYQIRSINKFLRSVERKTTPHDQQMNPTSPKSSP